jgi:hypothetical protein
MVYITKNISLKTLINTLSNGIIFILYSLCYMDQIDYLDTREGLVNRNGGSTRDRNGVETFRLFREK